MIVILAKTFNTLIAHFVSLVVRLGQMMRKPREDLIEGEIETVDWYKERTGFKGLDDLWETGAQEVARLLEEESETWLELQSSAIVKMNIAPVLDQTQLSSRCLERSARRDFLLLLKKIREFIEVDVHEMPALKVSHDIVARGVGLYAAYTRRRAVFYIYSESGELDNITVKMKGQTLVRLEKKKRRGRLMVGYVPPARGTYSVFVSKNGWMAPGCPYEVSVEDPPPGYRGTFGASEWNDPPDEFSPCDWDNSQETTAGPEYQVLLSEKGEKSETKLSKIVQILINAKRLFSRNKLDIPKIEISGSAGTPTFPGPSSEMESGPPVGRRRSFTFISAEGATFPLALSSDEDTKFFDTFDNLDIFRNDQEIWAVQTDEADSLSDMGYLIKSRRNSEEVFRLQNCQFLGASQNCQEDSNENRQINNTPSGFPKEDYLEHFQKHTIAEDNTAETENENLINTLKEENPKKTFEKLSRDPTIDDFNLNSLPSIDRQESASETSVGEKIIEVAIIKTYECTMKKEQEVRKTFGERRCKSVVSILDLNQRQKTGLRRTKSAIYRPNSLHSILSRLKDAKKIVVKIGEYKRDREEVKSSRTVEKLKHYWDNFSEKKERTWHKISPVKMTGYVANTKSVFEELARLNAKPPPTKRNKATAMQGFEKVMDLEQESNQPVPKKRKLKGIATSLERDLKGLFEDMNHGIGMLGRPNRLALLASLRSIEGISSSIGYDPSYPHLSTTKPSEFKPRTSCRDLIPWNQILSAY